MRVLVVEDDQRIASFLVKGLEAEGYETEVVDDGARAVSVLIAQSSGFDLVLLDLGLPRASGEDVLRLLRAGNTRLPVIVLTARDGERDKIHGLDLGANDYVTKPFSFAELLARVRAALRSSQPPSPTELAFGDLRLDLVTKVAWRAGRRIELTPKEWSLLEVFLRSPNRVLSRGEILKAVWNVDFEMESNVVDVYIGYLRRKIDRPGLEPMIKTVRGAGYRLVG
ncbi:MAG: response regulator transcription factor [Acidimicrobiales bacterium]